MSDNIFSAVLTFSLLAAGTIAVGSEMLTPPHATTQASAAATLPPVTVIGKRIARAEPVVLPTVMVTGCRHPDTEVAVDDSAGERRL
jgi:hypothetical protein